MFLAMFAVTNDVVSSNCRGQNDDIDNTSENGTKNNIIKLRDGLGYMRKRKRLSILRIKRFRLATEPERYYHSKLILYYPWVKEESLLDGFSSYQASYHSKIVTVQHNADFFNNDCDMFDVSPDEADNERTENTVWDIVAPSLAQDDALTDRLGFTMLQDNIEQSQSQPNRSAPGNDMYMPRTSTVMNGMSTC